MGRQKTNVHFKFIEIRFYRSALTAGRHVFICHLMLWDKLIFLSAISFSCTLYPREQAIFYQKVILHRQAKSEKSLSEAQAGIQVFFKPCLHPFTQDR